MDKIKQKSLSLLRRSESVFKTDMVYLAKGGFWLTLMQIVTALSSLALAVGFAHFLPKETYGTYKYIMSIGGIIAAFSLTGLGTVVTNAAARGQDGTLRFSFRKNLEWGLLTLALFVVAAAYYFTHGNTVLGIGLLIVGIVTPLLGSASLSDALFIGNKDFKKSALTSGLAVVLTNLITLGVAVITQSVLWLVGAYVFSNFILELVIYAYAVKTYPPRNEEIDPDAVTYGAHLSLIGILNIFVDRMDSILTFHFLGPAELAVYSFSIAMPEQIKALAKNASVLALPKYSAGDRSKVYHTMGRKMLIMGLVMLGIVAVYSLATPLLFRWFFPQYYSPGTIFLTRLYALSLITVVNTLPITYLQAYGLKRELYLFNIVGGILQILVMAFGLVYHGLLGLIIGIGVSRVFRLVYALLLAKRSQTAFSGTTN